MFIWFPLAVIAALVLFALIDRAAFRAEWAKLHTRLDAMLEQAEADMALRRAVPIGPVIALPVDPAAAAPALADPSPDAPVSAGPALDASQAGAA